MTINNFFIPLIILLTAAIDCRFDCLFSAFVLLLLLLIQIEFIYMHHISLLCSAVHVKQFVSMSTLARRLQTAAAAAITTTAEYRKTRNSATFC